MILFWLLGAAMITAALVIVLPPLVRQNDDVVRGPDALSRELHRQRLNELDTDLGNALITREDYEEARRELERAALAELKVHTGEPVAGTEFNPLTSAVVAVFIPVMAFGMYLNLGTLDGIGVGGRSDATRFEASAEGMPHSDDEMIASLEARLTSQPEDLDGWMMLARSYNAMEKPQAVVKVFNRALQVFPNEPLLLTDYAEFLARESGGDLGGEPAELLERALVRAPDYPKALLLSGLAAFQVGDLANTVGRLEKFRKVAQPEGEVAQVTADIISRAKMAMGDSVATGPMSAKVPMAAVPTTNGVQLTVSVRLADDYLQQVSPNDTVFIFARAAQGPRMPLAVVRKQVRDLPLSVVLTDSMAMTPAFKLSSFENVVAGARVSKTGNAISRPGDLQGLSGDLQVSTAGTVEVLINSVLP